MSDVAEGRKWHRVASVDELEEEDVVAVQVGGKQVALYSVEGEVYATDNICTHGKACLSDGFLEGYLIECPLHQGYFDIRDGSTQGGPVTEPVRSYPVRVDGDEVYIEA